MNACAGLADDIACGNGSRGSGGRRTGSLNLSNVRLLPGATSAPSRACLPADNLPSGRVSPPSLRVAEKKVAGVAAGRLASPWCLADV